MLFLGVRFLVLGEALEFDTTIDDGRFPAAWALTFFNTRKYGAFTFNPRLDKHLGVFYEDDLFPRIIQAAKTPLGRCVKSFVSLRYVDCGPAPTVTDVPQNKTLFYDRAEDEHVEVIRFTRTVVDAIQEECARYGFTEPPARGWDPLMMAITTAQAEEIATEAHEDLRHVLQQGWSSHVPPVFFITGDPRECPAFVDMIEKAGFFGQQNMAYLKDAMGPVTVNRPSDHYKTIGYEPRLNRRTGKYFLNSIYSRAYPSNVASLKESVKLQNMATYNDFLAMLGDPLTEG